MSWSEFPDDQLEPGNQTELVAFDELNRQKDDGGVLQGFPDDIPIDLVSAFEGQEESMTRFMLIRSMGIEHLQLLTKSEETNWEILFQTAYEGEHSEDEIVAFILEQWDLGENDRAQEYERLETSLQHIPIPEINLVRGDDPKKYINQQIRNKPDSGELPRRLDHLVSQMENYVHWTVYNQYTTDIVELFAQPLPANVIPVLRKGGIKGVDLFIQIEGKILPFDIKQTHIMAGDANNYFDKYDLIEKGDENSSFNIRDNAEGDVIEINMIKEALKQENKRRNNLRKEMSINIENLSKKHYKQLNSVPTLTDLKHKHGKAYVDEMIDYLRLYGDENPGVVEQIEHAIRQFQSLPKPKTQQAFKDEFGATGDAIKAPILEFIASSPKGLQDTERIIENRERIVKELKDDRSKIEWMNMVEQGATLFRNNNRIFVFLLIEGRVGNEDYAKVLKRNTQQITSELFKHLENITLESLNSNNYIYDKGSDKDGPYTGALTTSILITGQYSSE